MQNKPEERDDDNNANKDLVATRRNLIDQIDGFFNLLSHIIIEVNGAFQNRVVEQNVCTPELFKKTIDLFNIPLVADILAKDNIIYREVYKIFINEHPQLFKDIHENLENKLDEIEDILGPLESANDFFPPNNEMEDEKEGPKEITEDNIQSLNHGYTNNERLTFLYCLVRNYCNVIRSSSKKIDSFLELDVSTIITRLVQLRRAIITGGTKLYEDRLKSEYELHKESISAFDLKLKAENLKSEEEKKNEQVDMKEIIGKLSREEYMKKYAIVEDHNYVNANFSGVLEFDEQSRSNLEKEAEVCQSEAFKLFQLCWRRKVPSRRPESGKNNVKAIVNSTIYMSALFSQQELLKTFDPKNHEINKVDQNELMATLVKYNQVIEEHAKLMNSDAPYTPDFYLSQGFKHIFSLYHWLRETTPKLEKYEEKRILLSKHLQLLWSNIGDFFATVIECKFRKDGREVYALVTEKHKDENTFLSSVYYHICSEIFKQEDIITYFLHYSKYFLECLIDVMKLLISGDELGKISAPPDQRAQLFGARGRYGERQPPFRREYDDNTISQLTDLGFSRRLAQSALERNQGNVEMSIEYLLSLPSNVIEEDKAQDILDASADNDQNMENEEDKKEEDKMDVDDNGVVVCSNEDLKKAIKEWLKMLFNWILKGFNSTLTDVDVENITQFILKYISTDEDVNILMTTLIDSLKEMEKFLQDSDEKFSDIEYQKVRKSCLKKAATLSKILTHCSKYFIKKSDFIVSLMGCMTNLFKEHANGTMKFITKDKEIKLGEPAQGETLKTEIETFKDIMSNVVNIVLKAYGFYKLSCSDEVSAQIEKELKLQEESKGEESKHEEVKEKKDDKKDEKKDVKKDDKMKPEDKSIYDSSVTGYLKSIEAVETEDKEGTDKYLQQWKEKFSNKNFMEITLLIIDYCGENFDSCFTAKSFSSFLFFLLKLLEDRDNIEVFLNEQGFKKLLSLKSIRRRVMDISKSHFTNLVIKLIEDDSALLSVTENIIKKSLFFKHDEELHREIKDKAKENASKKKSKDKADLAKIEDDKEEGKNEEDKKEEVKEGNTKKEENKEEAKQTEDKPAEEKEKKSPRMMKSSSQEIIKTDTKSKSKVGKDSSVLKKSDINFNVFKNCSGVRLNQFTEQMRTIETRARTIFLKACSNLCEIETIKEYDCEMNVKAEYKIIKLKDSVLKEYISKTAKENTAGAKGQTNQIEKKELIPPQNIPQSKPGSLTARVKSSNSGLSSTNKKDNYLIS